MATVNPLGKRGKAYLPTLQVVLEMPALLVPGAGARNRINVMQRKATAYGMERAAAKHHKRRIPDHFNRSKQNKYNYKRRARVTNARKQARGIRGWDLVNTTSMRRTVTQAKQIRRVGTSRGTTVLLRMWMPPDMKPNRRGSQGVTMQVMKDEISQVTPQEAQDFTDDTSEDYLAFLERELSPRQRRRIPVLGGPQFSRAS